MRASRLLVLTRTKLGPAWLPDASSLIDGATDWFDAQVRSVYRARKVCTVWIVDRDEYERRIEARHAAIRDRAA